MAKISTEVEMLNTLKEIRDLLKANDEKKVQIDVKSFVKELSSGQLNADIVH